MKKHDFKNLKLNKKVISNLKSKKIQGGNMSNPPKTYGQSCHCNEHTYWCVTTEDPT